MGNMVGNNIEYLCSMFETIRNEALTPFLIECLLEHIIPRDEDGKLLVNYVVREKSKTPAVVISSNANAKSALSFFNSTYAKTAIKTIPAIFNIKDQTPTLCIQIV